MNYGLDDAIPIVRDIAEILKSNRTMVATMESCTAGLIAFYLTAVDGSSDYLEHSYVTYSNGAKRDLGVDAAIIDQYGVYSIQVAKEMALKASVKARCTYGIGITGMCGSNNESYTAASGIVIPPGTVCISVCEQQPEPDAYHNYVFTDQIINVNGITDRNDKREFSAIHALALFHRHLLYGM